jgi:hypothetical protein
VGARFSRCVQESSATEVSTLALEDFLVHSQALVQSYESSDSERLADGVYAFDKATRLDPWNITILLRIKQRLTGSGGFENRLQKSQNATKHSEVFQYLQKTTKIPVFAVFGQIPVYNVAPAHRFHFEVEKKDHGVVLRRRPRLRSLMLKR